MTFEFWHEPGTNYVWLKSPYCPEFIEILKSSVPWYERSWVSAQKLWRIDSLAARHVVRLCSEYCNEHGESIIIHERTPSWWSEVEDDRQRQKQEQRRSQWSNSRNDYSYTGGGRSGQQGSGHQSGGQRQGGSTSTSKEDPYSVLHLRESAPVEVIRGAYRALALLHHPDRGGDTETMKRVNNAWDQICKLKGIK
jgi:DnaJ domain